MRMGVGFCIFSSLKSFFFSCLLGIFPPSFLSLSLGGGLQGFSGQPDAQTLCGKAEKKKSLVWWRSEEWARLGTCSVGQEEKQVKLIQWGTILGLGLMLYLWMDRWSDGMPGSPPCSWMTLDPILSISRSPPSRPIRLLSVIGLLRL